METQPAFKAGDRVLCVDPSRGLTLGKTYLVERIGAGPAGHGPMAYITDDYGLPGHGFWARRFRLWTDRESVPVNGRPRGGSRVLVTDAPGVQEFLPLPATVAADGEQVHENLLRVRFDVSLLGHSVAEPWWIAMWVPLPGETSADDALVARSEELAEYKGRVRNFIVSMAPLYGWTPAQVDNYLTSLDLEPLDHSHGLPTGRYAVAVLRGQIVAIRENDGGEPWTMHDTVTGQTLGMASFAHVAEEALLVLCDGDDNDQWVRS